MNKDLDSIYILILALLYQILFEITEWKIYGIVSIILFMVYCIKTVIFISKFFKK